VLQNLIFDVTDQFYSINISLSLSLSLSLSRFVHFYNSYKYCKISQFLVSDLPNNLFRFFMDTHISKVALTPQLNSYEYGSLRMFLSCIYSRVED